MRKQRGQSAVEFALMAPIIFLLIFGMIYGGIMFMDYLNFNNFARTIAREVSLTTDPNDRAELVKKYNGYKGGAGVYLVTVEVEAPDDSEDVEVKINFTRESSFLMLPEEFSIVYRMKKEPDETT